MINVIEQYQAIKNGIPNLIELSGYRNDFVAKKLGMNPKYFSVKKQRGNRTEEELKKILEIISAPNSAIEDYLLLQLLRLKKEEPTISAEEFKKEMEWS